MTKVLDADLFTFYHLLKRGKAISVGYHERYLKPGWSEYTDATYHAPGLYGRFYPKDNGTRYTWDTSMRSEYSATRFKELVDKLLIANLKDEYRIPFALMCDEETVKEL